MEQVRGWKPMFLMFGMPILGWICNIIAMKFYEPDRERMVQVQITGSGRRELKEKKKAWETYARAVSIL